MDWDLIKTLGLGGLLGQALKSAAGLIYKTWTDKKKAKKEMLANDIESLEKTIESLFKLSMVYYGAPSAEGIQICRDIKIDVHNFIFQWNTVSGQLMHMRRPVLQTSHRDAFSQALIKMLDVERTEPLNIDHAHCLHMFAVRQQAREGLTALRYNLLN